MQIVEIVAFIAALVAEVLKSENTDGYSGSGLI